jgi:hypothetical protein
MRSNPDREFRDAERRWKLEDRFEGASCRCGEAHLECLVKRRRTRCYRCDRVSRGLPPVERHHIAGRNNLSLTITIDANLHRRLSHLQYNWPPWILRNPRRSALISVTGLMLGLLDLFSLLLECE